MSLYLGNNLISGVASPVEPTRNIGQIIQSTIPLTDAGLHLLDGSLIQGNGIYSAFVDYIADLYNDNPTANYFVQPYSIYVDITSDGTPISGGDYSGYPASNGFDGSTATQWWSSQLAGSVVGNAYLGKSGLSNKVTKVKLLQGVAEAERNYCTGIKFQYSLDNSTWVDILTVTDAKRNVKQEWDLPDYEIGTSTYSFRVLAYSGFVNVNNNCWVIQDMELYTSELLTPEQAWQQSITDYGVCGKFVYDSVNNAVRLPKITGIIEGTTDVTALGDLVQAGLPNITGSFASAYTTIGTGCVSTPTVTNAPSKTRGASGGEYQNSISYIDVSLSNSIYGNSSTVQPQAIKVLYYIVVATSAKTDIEVDIDEIATDLNGKADVDLTNVNDSGSSIGAGWTLPSNTYVDFTVGASGTTYTAPANGWFCIKVACENATGHYQSNYATSYGGRGQMTNYSYTSNGGAVVPMLKGQTLTFVYESNTINRSIRFVYAVGSESEAS